MMKILHTADWHIGKRLYQKELKEDHQLFFDWLVGTIRQEQVDVLLVSGDIFDLANPSAEARQSYYRALTKIAQTKVQVVLTGGNHDSPAMLNAPKELLQALNIKVIGDIPEKLEELIVPLYNSDQKIVAAVAAIPFIRDNELKKLAPNQTYEEREAAIRHGIQSIFGRAFQLLQELHPGAVPLAMGHLFTHGASTSESERDVQVGNLAGFNAENFPEGFAYIALGHIHKPQKAGAEHILYSGSPISLSFSEKTDAKRILLVTVGHNGLEDIRSIPIPKWRQLQRFSGSLSTIAEGLSLLGESSALPTFIELQMQAKSRNPVEMLRLEEMVNQFNEDRIDAEIVKYAVKLTEHEATAANLFTNQQIKELKPEEVFTEWLATHELEERSKSLLMEAFNDLLQTYYQNH